MGTETRERNHERSSYLALNAVLLHCIIEVTRYELPRSESGALFNILGVVLRQPREFVIAEYISGYSMLCMLKQYIY